ncbi:MAG: M48 family metallopeptidase [Verrucomicrobiae bacterium]|nr:M48 family metallopeptidase [Verrucomicrobiae bacterium]
MDFFESQQVAQRKTAWLIALYVAAVLMIVVSLYLVFWIVGFFAWAKGALPMDTFSLWHPKLLGTVAASTGFIVGTGTLYKIATLRSGAALAAMVGGKPINTANPSPAERRLLNVVEEMAIASGVRVPDVYVLENETAINAFASGFTAQQATICVTRGCLELLNRDELQGVIGHEFSHILHGDMRLNMRLVGVLHGILLIYLIGYFTLRAVAQGRGGGKNDPRPIIILIALAVMAIGWIGAFFARLIKSAVSRQREFLADASSVQFTRNPEGIAGALKKIGGWGIGSHLASANAEQVSHFFFANGLASPAFSLLATHPPLVERIKRIDSNFDGRFPVVSAKGTPMEAEVERETATALKPRVAAPSPLGWAAGAAAVVAQIGQLRAENVAQASRLVAGIPDSLRSAAREPGSAAGVVLALLLPADDAARSSVLEQLRGSCDPAVLQALEAIAPEACRLAGELRLPLADLCLPALRHLSAPQFENFKTNMQTLVEADSQIDLFEFTLSRMVARNLEARLSPRKPKPPQYYALAPLAGPCSILLSAVAQVGSSDPKAVQQAFGCASSLLGDVRLELKEINACGIDALGDALDELGKTSIPMRKRVLEACAATISCDGRVTIEEAELFRAIADSFDCPVPPLFPSIATAEAAG